MCESHLLFPKKANVTPGGLTSCFLSHIFHLWVTCAFSRKSKCDSWGPLLLFLESYLSSVSDICFFQKKQMWLLGASANVSGLISNIYEWHLLFPEKANVTPGGPLPVFLHMYWHLWVAFAFLEKANLALCLFVWSHICYMYESCTELAPLVHEINLIFEI